MVVFISNENYSYSNFVSMAEKYPGFIFIFDGRYDSNNPSMQIYNSCLISDEVKQQEILMVMIQYDISNPSGKKWGRTLDSMMLEWKVHNNFYYLTGHIRVAHTDFDYLDENTTRIGYIWRAFVEGVIK